ncbi:MAG TPA: hypothetical protein VLJ68_12690 [Chitinophagaceae bacterium]|nr:hypothetical protein [Chitinophagaceae bacterium]
MKKLPLFFFALFILSYSCKNKDSAPDSFKEQLIGSWDWVSSTGGIDGGTRTPANEGQTKSIRFDSAGKYYSYVNGVEVQGMSFTISAAIDKKAWEGSRMIKFSKKDEAPNNKQGYSQNAVFRGKDTLVLQDDCVDCYTNLYVRSTGNDASRPIIESDTLYNSGLDVYSKYLPPTFRAYVTDYVTGWTIPKENAWEKYWWDQYKKDKSLVNYVSGDFNCDNKTDYSMILTDPRGAVAAWVFMAKGNDFEKTMLEQADIEEGPIAIGIDLLKKGKQGDMITNKTADIKCDGVSIVFFERAQHSYYWEKGKFKMIQTGD